MIEVMADILMVKIVGSHYVVMFRCLCGNADMQRVGKLPKECHQCKHCERCWGERWEGRRLVLFLEQETI